MIKKFRIVNVKTQHYFRMSKGGVVFWTHDVNAAPLFDSVEQASKLIADLGLADCEIRPAAPKLSLRY